MARFFKKRKENEGLPPGSLVFIGTQKVEQPHIRYREYNEEELSYDREISILDLPKVKNNKVQWYNVVGLHNADLMADIKEQLKIHPLAMEDVMNTGHRAKYEEFSDHIFITLKVLRFDETKLLVSAEQISFIFNHKMLVTFQEDAVDVFDHIRRRLENSSGIIRKSGTDYLAYALLDSIVDHYIYLIESIGEKIDDLELKVLESTDRDLLRQINTFKRELHFIIKVVKPVRELLAGILRSRTEYIQREKVRPYFKDLEGLVIHAIESVEAYRSLLTDYLSLYHSNMSTRMNDIMRILTIFSAIFIPLSFFAGVYGTNFQYLPELDYRYAYPIFWGAVIIVALSMLLFFKRKGWL